MDGPTTFKNVDLEKFIGGLHDYMARALRPLTERIKQLEAEVAALKAPKE